MQELQIKKLSIFYINQKKKGKKVLLKKQKNLELKKQKKKRITKKMNKYIMKKNYGFF